MEDKGKKQVQDRQQPIDQWTKEDVQKWIKKMGWEERGHFFLEANGNDLILLRQKLFHREVGRARWRSCVYCHSAREKYRY